MLEEKFKIFVEDNAIKSRIFIGFFLEEEGPTALDNERQKPGLKDSLVSNEIGKPKLVNKEHITDEKEVNIGPVSGQQNNRKLAVLFNLPDLLKHLHVDGNLLVETLENFMKSIGHCPHDRNLDLCN